MRRRLKLRNLGISDIDRASSAIAHLRVAQIAGPREKNVAIKLVMINGSTEHRHCKVITVVGPLLTLCSQTHSEGSS